MVVVELERLTAEYLAAVQRQLVETVDAAGLQLDEQGMSVSRVAVLWTEDVEWFH